MSSKKLWILTTMMMTTTVAIVAPIVGGGWMKTIVATIYAVVTVGIGLEALIPGPDFTFRDRVWVVQAYLRGKVLRQSAYRPRPTGYGGHWFCLPVPITARRLNKLMEWWGVRCPTEEEIRIATNREFGSDYSSVQEEAR